MFTGIVEEIGTVRAIEAGAGVTRLAVACADVVDDAREGDSISVNGCCLTVTTLQADGFTSDLMGETLARTALGDLRAGDPVNLERALLASTRLGGHLVQGHVDAVAEILAVEPHEEWTVMTFSLPDELARYVVEKGSITVDGTSLTVMEVGEHGGAPAFSAGLIPHTLAVTTHGRRAVGDRVNLEVDVIAKYVERMLAAGTPTPYTPPPTTLEPADRLTPPSATRAPEAHSPSRRD
jgi:riboflavin synthase